MYNAVIAAVAVVANSRKPVSNMLNKLHGQPDSYDKKYTTIPPFARLYLANEPADPSIGSDEPSVLAHMVLSERQKDRKERSQ